MSDFRPILLSDREQVERIRKTYGEPCSANCFSVFFLWKTEQKLSIHLDKEFFAVLSEEGDVPCYTAICGQTEERMNFIQSFPSGTRLAYQTDQDKQSIEQAFPNNFEWKEDAGSSEYIYDVQKQTELKGGEFAGMRSKIHKAMRDHSFAIEEINAENLGRVLRITQQWNSARTEQNQHWFGDAEAAINGIENFFELGLSGILIKDENDDTGYIFGSEISEKMFDIHCSKVSTFDDHLDLVCKYLFYRSILGKYSLVNREEDMGLPGLRMRKMNCQPAYQIRMWTAEKR